MTSKTYRCPACNHALQLTTAPAKSAKNPQPYVILHCGNVTRCPSAEATNNGGSGPTEAEAYRSLLLSVKAAEDKEIEEEEPLTAEEQHERNQDWKAEHANDMARSGGA